MSQNEDKLRPHSVPPHKLVAVRLNLCLGCMGHLHYLTWSYFNENNLSPILLIYIIFNLLSYIGAQTVKSKALACNPRVLSSNHLCPVWQFSQCNFGANVTKYLEDGEPRTRRSTNMKFKIEKGKYVFAFLYYIKGFYICII